MPKGPLQLRELIARLKPYGVVVLQKRGKGSETILLKPLQEGSRQGPMYVIKNHGQSTEISIPVINSTLTRFGIGKEHFWD